MNETDPVLLLAKSLENTVDPISGQTKDGVNTPRDQALYKYIRCIGHLWLRRQIVPQGWTLAWTPICFAGLLKG
jgi:hypothetical protein